MGVGAFCLELHGHLPWVLHHGRWPHGEDWLFEAAAETWLPLLDVLETCVAEGIRPAWTLGLTPILLEQLAHPRFRSGFATWLDRCAERAARDSSVFGGRGDAALAEVAAHHGRDLRRRIDQLHALDGDLVGALGAHADAGRIELISSNATHGYHPLVLHDRCARALLRAGLATSARHLGHRPRGIWLPECAYRPAGPWTPPAVYGDARDRAGVAELLEDVGVAFFTVDAPLVGHATPFASVPPGEIGPNDGRCWGSVLEPVRVAERGRTTSVAAIGRSPVVSEQVWSGEIGYPGDPAYLEFHKRHGPRGLRYWRITGAGVDLGDKQPYLPGAVAAVCHAQAVHFVETVERAVQGHHAGSGRYGVVCAPFDAELFGHWWHEGPQWLLEVARRVHHCAGVDALTVSELLERAPPDKAVAMAEGSWGAGGDHRVWLNDGLRFYWEIAYRAEDRFLDLWHRAPWSTREEVAELVREAARQLLLLQASDWPFVVSTQGAVDYGLRRILGHAARFDDLCNGVEDLLEGRAVDPVVVQTLARCRLVDPVFPDLDLDWWRP